ncbi:MAG: aldehyde dehydrogenase family protein [Cytophagales bacterium]|nr:aldehyde dehydrogenase family protein [Bernardetiaceae bacterium]MDW8204110.1 aldehyde dehydrogenase family protein [Cytophagales bacterium]
MSHTTYLEAGVLSFTEVFAAQQKAAIRLRNSTAAERIAKLKKLMDAIKQHEHAFIEAIYADFRKPRAEVIATELLPTLMDARHAIAHLPKWMQPKKVSTPASLFGAKSYVQYEPKGVSLIIAPWNYPIYLVFGPLIYALAAGCTAIVKPSELTPHTAAVISRVIAQTFAPEEVACFEGGAEVSAALLELPFHHIFFTGSPAIGKIVMQAAAKHLSSVTLELGGKSPAFVDESADLKDAAEKLVWGKFVNNGQTCVAPDYLLVHCKQQEGLVGQIKNTIDQYYNPDNQGIEHSSSYARIVNEKHFWRIHHLLTDALDKGAQIAIGGKTIAEERFIAPTVLTHVTSHMKIMQEEIFGPVLPIVSYNTLEEAIDFVNSMDKPLALYIFSKDDKKINQILKTTSAGGTCINDCIVHLANPCLPFGGINNSGLGKTHGFYGFEAFSNPRAVLRQRVGFTTVKTLYPPYGEKIDNMLKMMRHFFA